MSARLDDAARDAVAGVRNRFCNEGTDIFVR